MMNWISQLAEDTELCSRTVKPRPDRLREFAEYLDTLPTSGQWHYPGTFSIEKFYYDNDCGTPACVAAHAIHRYFPERKYFGKPNTLAYMKEIVSCAEVILGLEHEIAMILFLPEISEQYPEAITAKHAAAAIRAIIAGKETESDIWAAAINDYHFNHEPEEYNAEV